MPHWVGYILTIIVSVQTLAAVNDVHQFHQPNNQVLDFDSSTQESEYSPVVEKISNVIATTLGNTVVDNQPKPSNLTSSFDCEHCCHCHSCHTHILIRESLPEARSLSNQTNPRGSVNSAQIGILSQPYRPPRV